MISVADIPGIISGAHNNRGLGFSFLRHIQRTKVLTYVIDVSDGVHLPNQVYREIQKELLHYDESLLRKPTIIVANKIDEEGAEKGLALLKSVTKLPIIGMGGISCLNDLFEFISAGADAFEVGTQNFTQCDVCNALADELENFIKTNGLKDFEHLKEKIKEIK